jgi:hypothetical protein
MKDVERDVLRKTILALAKKDYCTTWTLRKSMRPHAYTSQHQTQTQETTKSA